MTKANVKILTFCILASTCAPYSVAKEACKTSPYELQKPEGYDHKRYAPSPIERFYDGKGFIASVDGSDNDDSSEGADYLVAPVWVSYHLKAFSEPDGDGFAPGWKRPRDWYRIPIFDVERTVHESGKRIDDSYDGVGKYYNRGHLAQRADLNRISPEMGCNSHVFANAVPQRAEFNQGIWLGLENYISGMANKHGEVWVSAGPIYGSRLSHIGETDKDEIPVAIPTALWKTLTWVENGNLQWRAWIYPNADAGNQPAYRSGKCSKDKKYSHQGFLVSLREIEEDTGLRLLPKFEGDLRDAILDYKHKKMPVLEEEYRVGACL